MSDDKPPYPDFPVVVKSRDFHGVAWVPTTVLRWIERQNAPDEHKFRELQQMWETHVINNSGAANQVSNPNYTQWRDIPFVTDPHETGIPGEADDNPEIRPG